MDYSNTLIFILMIAYAISSPMKVDDNYEFKMYEHPKCDMYHCSLVLNRDDFFSFYDCRDYHSKIFSESKKYGLTFDEAIAICIYTKLAIHIGYILPQGNPGLYGCYMDHINSGLYKIWKYNRFYNIQTVEYLYTGINLDRSKAHALVDGTTCSFKKGDTIVFPSIGSTTTSYNEGYNYALKDTIEGGILFKIKTLKSKTKAIPVAKLSVWSSESEFFFPPASKFKVTSNCIRSLENNNIVLYTIDLEEIEEMEDMKEYETQKIDENENILKEYTKACTQCNDNVHNYCKYCEDRNKCSECYAGYIPNKNGICIKCENSCLKCDEDDTNKCTDCYKAYGLVKNECKKCSDKNCLNCNGDIKVCQLCRRGYILINGECIKKEDSWCNNYTYEYIFFKKCTECIGPTYLENGKCIECKEKGCLKCSKLNKNEICIECMDGYGIENGNCIKCSEGCKKCMNNKCLECENNFYLYNNEICKRCDYNCLECQNDSDKCTECPLNRILRNNKCEYCGDDCKKCHYEKENKVCDLCDNGYFLKNGKCYKCIEGCSECINNSECLSCYNHYTINEDKQCVRCSDSCEKCRIKSGKKDETLCGFCSDFYYYMDSQGECQKCEGEGCDECIYKSNQKICTKCKYNEKYILANGKCGKCDITNCNYCNIDSNDQQTCLYCKDFNNLNLLEFNSYGRKDRQCFECESEECMTCEKNPDTGSLECINDSNILFVNLKSILFLFFFFMNLNNN